jgi:hypothetical protein
MKGYAALFFGSILIAAFVLKEYSAGVSAIFTMTPWWMYFVLCGIIYSGYRAVTGYQEERSTEDRLIEEEGKVYMKRIEEAKKLEQHEKLDLAEKSAAEQQSNKASGE